TRGRRKLLDNITDAVTQHYVVSFTVGTLLILTALALFAFMAFTLILIPIAIIGIFAGLATLGYGIISWGYLIGTHLPVARPGLATGLGVAAMVIVLQVTAEVPLVGGLVVLGIVLTAVGAVAITYYGVTSFQAAALPD
ncbi:MAG TPA: polymer-forming cytoskeletal protein, partial [Acidimicrobiia bacterium]|nr:polymer-forming cytoskeletal protein [Acidimicrobiia bacterium]